MVAARHQCRPTPTRRPPRPPDLPFRPESRSPHSWPELSSHRRDSGFPSGSDLAAWASAALSARGDLDVDSTTWFFDFSRSKRAQTGYARALDPYRSRRRRPSTALLSYCPSCDFRGRRAPREGRIGALSDQRERPSVVAVGPARSRPDVLPLPGPVAH